ncbi:TetR family transcriptional regulator [Sporosarcina sp. NCCP-2331]|nr:TetR family transcriptional regulator [Sporosarcina sp. NCCP-2331]GLB55683.1 TetR family transcriptional regulator [Sporosarcina sp. NCCP-2378]
MQEKNVRNMRRDAMENNRIILEEARKLIHEQGFYGKSMHQIAKAAGIGQGTLYRRYAHKGELCLALLLDMFEKNSREMEDYLLANRNQPLEVRMKRTLAGCLEFVDEQCQLLSAISSHNCEEDRTITYHSPIYKSRHAMFRRLLEELPAGRLTADPVCTADLIIAAFAPNLYQFLRDDRRYTIEKICENIFGMYLEPLFRN